MEMKIINKARGLYRWERDQGWEKHENIHFEEDDAIIIDPFGELIADQSKHLWPVYGTFLEYVTEDIAKVYIPPEGTNSKTWFKGVEGEYLIHEGYLTLQ